MMEMDPILLGEILAGTLFFGIIFVLALGFPVAYTLAGTSLMIAAIGWYFEVFDFSNFGALASRYVGFMSSEVLVAVPLFIFMGVLLERSGIAEALLTTMGRLFGNVRGGLGFSVMAPLGRALRTCSSAAGRAAPCWPPPRAWWVPPSSPWASSACPPCCVPAMTPSWGPA